MESLHRRKLSNANGFSGKHAYDGVFSGSRESYDGARAPAVSVDEYREIFCSSGSSIPVLDLSNLDESSGDLNLEVESTDYGRIFGGFREHDIAVSYEELLARDEARAPSSTSQSSPDLGDTSHQSSDALKRFNLSYHKISQRNKDGLDGTTHVTQLHAVPGFTCFIDESASQPNKKSMKQKSSSTNNVNVNSSNRDFLEKQTATNSFNAKSTKRDFSEKQASQSSVEFSKYQEDSLSDNRTFKSFEADLKSHPSKVLSSPESKKETKKQKPPATNNDPSSLPAASQPKKETENQKPPATNNVPASTSAASQPKKETEKQKSPATNNAPASKSAASQTKKETEKQKPPATNNVPASISAATQPKNETEKQKPPATNNVPASTSAASQPKNETEKQKPPATNNVPASTSAASQQMNETEKQKPPATNNVPSSLPAASQAKNETEKQKPPATNNVPSSPPSASQPKKETKKQKSSVTDNEHPCEKVDFSEKQTSQTAVESQRRYGQDEAFSDNRNFKTFQADYKSFPSKVSSSHAASATNSDNHKDYQKRSTVKNEEFPPTCFDEEVHVNAAAAALRKAIEKAQESIRIAKESVGRKKEGLRGFSSRSFKDSLKAKVRVANVNAGEEQKEKDDKMKERDHKNGSNVNFRDFADGERLFGAKKVLNEMHGKVSESIKNSEIPIMSPFESNNNKMANVNAGEEQKEKDDKMKERDHKNESNVIFQDFADGERLFGTKKVLNEMHGKVSESVKNSEIPITSPFELNYNKMACNLKHVVGETETKSIENNACENPHKDDERPNGFLVLESCEKEQGDTESNNLTVCQKVETKKELSQTSDQNGYEKKFSEESFGLLENHIQENLEQEQDEVVNAERQDEDERQVKENGGTESHSKEEKFYDVCEVKMVKKAHTHAYNIETNYLSRKEDYENRKAEETYENSSSDYDDAEENENVIGASNIEDDTEKACNVDQNVDQNDNIAESSQDIDDVGSSHQFQVEYKEAVENDIFENISSDETEDKVECEAKPDNLENCGLGNVDFGQNDVQFESSSDTIHGMEIEVKEYKEREETAEEEENNFQQSHEETPEIRIEMDTGTPHEPKDACRESELSKAAHDKEERERERIKLAVDRAIREARERAFAEVRQRVIADTQEKVTKASIDKTSAQSKLRAERALVERATAEARQRALEKVMKTSQPRTQVSETKQTSTTQTNTESALRSKAKLEKHNRIMERAAKALAEKEKRDLLALREQAERNRLAEHLDADIKRWSTGKEGNLRALLSTLQYILGADSGWQPVSLTEIITTTAVKKAYRKATLCVHPDKLQQRGASIQQKYICEKVFDLLKAAWNRFNSEER